MTATTSRGASRTSPGEGRLIQRDNTPGKVARPAEPSPDLVFVVFPPMVENAPNGEIHWAFRNSTPASLVLACDAGEVDLILRAFRQIPPADVPDMRRPGGGAPASGAATAVPGTSAPGVAPPPPRGRAQLLDGSGL